MDAGSKKYEKGMDLQAWVDAHAGVDVTLRLAISYQEVVVDSEVIEEEVDYDRFEEQTGRLVGIVG